MAQTTPPGSQYAFFAAGLKVNLVTTTDGNHSVISGAVRVGDNGVMGTASVTGFSQTSGDRIFFPSETPAAINNVVASAQTNNGNTIIMLPDGTTMTLVGITSIDNTFFG